MSDRNTKLIQAAMKVFARYGYSKATMNDVAREAGVARQTLYNAYPGKEELLRTTIRELAHQSMISIENAWTDEETLDGKLDRYFELGPLDWYDIGESSPDAAELFDGIHKVAREEIDQISIKWNKHFEDLILEFAEPGTPAHKNAKELGEFIYAASSTAKYNADGRKVVEQRLQMLKMSVLALIRAGR